MRLFTGSGAGQRPSPVPTASHDRPHGKGTQVRQSSPLRKTPPKRDEGSAEKGYRDGVELDAALHLVHPPQPAHDRPRRGDHADHRNEVDDQLRVTDRQGRALDRVGSDQKDGVQHERSA